MLARRHFGRLLFALTLITGALSMSDTATADEPKKDEPKTLKVGDVTYDTKVTVKVWDAMGKKFLNPVKDVWAVRIDKKDDAGKPVIIFRVRGTADNNTPSPKSVIIDKEGNEFTVIEGEKVCRVELTKPAPKPVEKKP